MPSATDFLPSCITQFVNLATSLSLNFGSGVILRLGTSLRRGMAALFFLLLGPLDAVLGSAAVAVRLVRARRADGTRSVERPAHHVVADARQVLHAATANQDDAVLLEV